MTPETAAELRAQAAHARHLADKMRNPGARQEMREVANMLDAKATRLDGGEMPHPTVPTAKSV